MMKTRRTKTLGCCCCCVREGGGGGGAPPPAATSSPTNDVCGDVQVPGGGSKVDVTLYLGLHVADIFVPFLLSIIAYRLERET
jgi:hypothetical protein